MDFIDPGFHHSLRSEIKFDSTQDPQQSPAEMNPQLFGLTNTSGPESTPSTNSRQKSVIQTHWDNMEALRERKTVHLSRSLDHYCHQRVSSEELQKRVNDQVLTRFMKRQLSTGQETSQTPSRLKYLKMLTKMYLNVVRQLRSSISRPRDSVRPEAAMEEGQEKGTSTTEAAADTRASQNAAPNTHGNQLPPQILVVPQLWLWKFDSECKFNTYGLVYSNLRPSRRLGHFLLS